MQSKQAGIELAFAPRPLAGATQRVGAFSALPALMRELDCDPASMLREAGLDARALDGPEGRIPYRALGVLLATLAARARCAHLGLLVGRMWHLQDLGDPGQVVLNTPTIGAALRQLTVYQHLNSGAVVPFVHRSGNVVDFGCAIYGGDLPGVDILADMYMAAAMNFMRDLCGPAWIPTEVHLPHAPPADVVFHRHYFKARLHFDAPLCALRFPVAWLEHPVPGADPLQLRAAEDRARAVGIPNVREAVMRALRVLLLDGLCAGDDVARALSMHRRTLNRRLQAEGTTFQQVLDETRFDLARQLLRRSDIALDDVAAILGYASISPFMRTFRRWAGTTPARWRDAARVQGSATGAEPKLQEARRRHRAAVATR